MEIEKKYLVNLENMPFNLDDYPYHNMEQAYLCTDPVVRVRMEDDNYYMTYKSRGLMSREEYNLPLDVASYAHLLSKADGTVITKKRYIIPFNDNNIGKDLIIELDIFDGKYAGLVIAEIEFECEDDANAIIPPSWFGDDVTFEKKYHNSEMSKG